MAESEEDEGEGRGAEDIEGRHRGEEECKGEREQEEDDGILGEEECG